MSKMERTLRLPYLITSATKLLLTRTIPIWATIGLFGWFLTQSIFVSVVMGFLLTLAWEMFSLLGWYEKRTLPQHLSKLDSIKSSFEKLETYSTSQLKCQIEETTKKSAWSIINILYLALPSWGWEIIFLTLYPFLVSDKQIPYQNHLVGFGNKSTEADQCLWDTAQEKDHTIQNKLLENYLDIYGSRTEDLDLALPTLRERPKAITSLLVLYKRIPSPKFALELAKNKRDKSLKHVLKHLRIPKGIFLGLLKIVRKNVSLREDRRYYEFQADYYLRQMLLRLAKLTNISSENIFNMSWDEVKKCS